ncbi:RDD family protein [sulfur-oxidizing endosymbiont of Gigantopelta aegis]|uniref:RDD family protein n=1 Tax=sulfur-oxidizing endosymbiont of Gigantopelta aegis TaxID=2794934 RepID=UPI0018DCD353|nr:RDD family protein [sulfur-oxidizing endosymbiont of Gigantopelta aegis]
MSSMLDTIKTVETPEGVELKLTCAGFYVRSIAWLLDILIQGLIIIVFALLLSRLGDFGQGILLIVMFLQQWLYPVFFEIYFQGQTPGKKKMNIQVLQIDGTMVTWEASLLRNLLRTVDFLPFFYALGVVSMLLSRDFRRLGDLAANTIVVYTRKLKDNSQLVPEVAAIAPNIALSGIEQQIIVNYAERFKGFSPERAEELARLATPLLDGVIVQKKQTASETNASERLLGIANYLMGRR